MSRAYRLLGEHPELDLGPLWDHGCQGLWQRGDDLLAYFAEPLELPLPGVWEDEDRTDYLARYYAELKPVQVGRLTVAPTHLELSPEPGRHLLRLDPGMAFGTGHHETTRLALAALEREDLAGRDVLDLGAGSGILAIASDLLGARSARGRDLDPDTLPVALENARLNRSSARFAVGSLADEPAGSADLVVANLYAELHAGLVPEYARALRPDGRLLLTGILAERRQLVENALGAAFRVTETHADGEWLLIAAEPHVSESQLNETQGIESQVGESR